MMWRCWLAAVPVLLAACGAAPLGRRAEGIDSETIPPEVRPDYAVLAQRCSKCHSLSRVFNAGITDDDEWALYVARMRRQPSSGISEADTKAVLRFLHYYVAEQVRAKSNPGGGR